MGKGKGPAAACDEEEALLGDRIEHEGEGEAGPSRRQEMVSEERYRDEVNNREGGGRGERGSVGR